MDMTQVWGYPINNTLLTKDEIEYLNNLPDKLPAVEWVWQEMDRIWRAQKLDYNCPLSQQSISDYYAHPVWLMNGIFTVLDPVSTSHRKAIATYLNNNRIKSIADYGGGFGALAQAIVKIIPDASISIIEPYPSKIGLEQIINFPKIEFVSHLISENYEAVIAQDVLEHIEDPILLAFQMANATRMGGKVIFANCFYPVIQCHLPSTFHLRDTFPWVMKALGLRYIGTVEGAVHAQIYEKTNELNLSKARSAETISRLISPIINVRRKAKQLIKRVAGKH
ncbi:MAG: methyltransferase [Methylococcaceae bacterium]